MQNQFCDGYSVGFGTFDGMRAYHEELSRESLWLRCASCLSQTSPCRGTATRHA